MKFLKIFRRNGGSIELFETRVLDEEDAVLLAENEAQELLGVSAEDAFVMLDKGELDGTIAGAEMSRLRSLIAG